jgi:hypothetical protein
VLGVILTNTPLRAIEVSRTGCLLESRRRIEVGTTGELRLKIERRTYSEVVTVMRCQRLEGAAASYRLGVEFLRTRRPSSSSLRFAVSSWLEAKGFGAAANRTAPVSIGQDSGRNRSSKGAGHEDSSRSVGKRRGWAGPD